MLQDLNFTKNKLLLVNLVLTVFYITFLFKQFLWLEISTTGKNKQILYNCKLHFVILN